jgi:hypothetical protein
MERIVGSLFSREKPIERQISFAKEESIYRVGASRQTAALKLNFKDL